MRLAHKFLIVCGNGVDLYGVEELKARVTYITGAYLEIVDHGSRAKTAMRGATMSREVKVTDPKILVEGHEMKDLSSLSPLRENLAKVELPFHSRPHTEKEMTEYDEGFNAGIRGNEFSDEQSEAWQSGWAEAQE
jgi:hypothetical protein